MRTLALPAVIRHLRSLGPAVVGCDFPFSLPVGLDGAFDSRGWRGLLTDFPARYRSAEAFRDACRTLCNGRELRRLCDFEAKVPFCAWNLRLYRQTWHGIAEILRPLVLEADAVVLPMDEADPTRLWLVEVCPASFLKRIRLYESYKGRSADQRAMRETILSRLVADRLLAPPSPQIERTLLDDVGGDALDAAIAAVITWRNHKDGTLDKRPRTEAEALEGREYV